MHEQNQLCRAGEDMAYVTAEEIRRAKEIDLLTYLRRMEPQELVQIGANTYCTREHDSLKISNGKWHWFSRGIGGRTALDYLIKVKDYTFTQAVETLLGRTLTPPPVRGAPEPVSPRRLLLPQVSDNPDAVVRYLLRRGIHREIINECIARKLLYETLPYHNAMFVGYDPAGRVRYAALRSTTGTYKGEAPGSDKHYSFSISAQKAETVHVFESAIDLLSYVTLALMEGRDWRQDALLSLAGVYKTKRVDAVPVALSRFLADYPAIGTLHLHLDNDDVGRGAAQSMMRGLAGKYTVIDEPPAMGKDVNEMLQMQCGIRRGKEGWHR